MQVNTGHEFFKNQDSLHVTWRLAKAGDFSAREQLIRAAVLGARSAARKLGLNAHDQDEVSQMVAVTLLDKFPIADCPRNFDGMVWGLSRSAASSHWRKRRRLSKSIDEIPLNAQPVSQGDFAWSQIAQEEAERILYELIRELRSEQRLVIEQHFLAGRSVQEIATELKESRTIIYRRLQQACDALAIELARRGIES